MNQLRNTIENPPEHSRLTLRTPYTEIKLTEDECKSFGRAGQLEIRDRWKEVPAVAGIAENRRGTWHLSVPIDVKLWIGVYDNLNRIWSGTGGESYSSSLNAATIIVQTTLGRHPIKLAWRSASLGSLHASGTTVAPAVVLDPCMTNERPWIVACADRLDLWNAHSLTDNQIADVLQCEQKTISTRLGRSRELVQGWMQDAGNHSTDRDEIIDWLVSTGAVTKETVILAIDEELSFKRLSRSSSIKEVER